MQTFFKGKSTSGIPSLIEGNHIHCAPSEKAQIFNNFFSNNSTMGDPPVGFALPPLHFRTKAKLSEVIFNPVKVYSVLKQLQTCKASGPDLISNKMLKETAEVMAKPLSDIFNKSMEYGSFPSIWKRANVMPVFKKANRQIKENYRPISLLSCVGKVMERVVFTELYEYCLEHSLLTWRNSGFKKNESTTNQLLNLVHKIYENMDNGDDALVVFFRCIQGFR